MVNYYKLIPILIEALKEQQSIIDDQKKELFELKRTSIKNKELIDRICKHLKKEDN